MQPNDKIKDSNIEESNFGCGCGPCDIKEKIIPVFNEAIDQFGNALETLGNINSTMANINNLIQEYSNTINK